MLLITELVLHVSKIPLNKNNGYKIQQSNVRIIAEGIASGRRVACARAGQVSLNPNCSL